MAYQTRKIDRDLNKNPLQYLTYRQAADLLQMSERKLATMKKNGEIPYIQLGKSIRFSRTHLEQWLSERTQGGDRQSRGEGRDR